MSDLREYLVEWTINITASTPEEAARQARAIQLDPTSMATCFHVQEQVFRETGDEPEEEAVLVDLYNIDTGG